MFYLANRLLLGEGMGWIAKLMGGCYRERGNRAGLVSMRAESRGLGLLVSGEFQWLGVSCLHSLTILKPKECAFVLGLIALGFVLVRHRFCKNLQAITL